MKNKFYGKYYKFISDSGYVFSCIISNANEGDMIQIITPDGAFFIDDTKSMKLIKLKQNNILFWEQYNLKKKWAIKYIKNAVSKSSINSFIFSFEFDVSGKV